ncbi:MAG: nucleotidyltransferase family protein [Albidovulum sp.]
MQDITILIPAAGASRRMRGSDKLLEPVGGVSVLRRTADIAAGTGAKVVVTLPDTGPILPARRATLVGSTARLILIKDAHEGMAASLRAGAREAGQTEALMVMLPDNPDIEASDLTLMLTAFKKDPTVALRAATGGGTQGHPVIFPRRLFQELTVLTGDRGGRIVLADENVRSCPLPGRRAVTDLDTPEDWAVWRKESGR